MKYWILLISQLLCMATTAPSLANGRFCSEDQSAYYSQARATTDSRTISVKPIAGFENSFQSNRFQISSVTASILKELFSTEKYKTVLYYLPSPIPAPCRTTGHFTGPDSVCTGSKISYKADFHAGSSYKWSIIGGSITFGDSTDSIVIVWGAAGTGNIQLKETDSSCSSTTSIKITILSLPKPSFSGDSETCAISNSLYTAHLDSGATYSWRVVNGTILLGKNSDSMLVKWGHPGVGRIILIETNAGGCTDSIMSMIKIDNLPHPILFGDSSICIGNTILYQTHKNGRSVYTWHITNGSIISGQNTDSVMVNWSGSGTGSITLIETNSNGCTDSVTKSITINPLPNLSLFGDSSLCAGASLIYMANKDSTISYKWNIVNGNILSGQNTDSISVSWPASGTGSLSLIETNANGCTDSTRRTVHIHALPSVSIFGDSSICAGVPGLYVANIQNGNSYKWKVKNGSIKSGQNTDSATFLFTGSGIGYLTLIETNENGCSDSITKSIKVYSHSPSFIIGNDTVCAGTMASYKTISHSGSIYQWKIKNGSLISGQSTDSVVINWTSADTGEITLIETNANGCTDSSTMDVNVMPKPVASISGDTEQCIGTTSKYKVMSGSSSFTYKWTVSNGTLLSSATADSISVNWTKAGTDSIKLLITNANGCKDSTIKIIHVNPLPSAHFTATKFGNEFDFHADDSLESTYFWNFGDSFMASGVSVKHTYASSGTYTAKLTVTSATGCTATADSTITFTVSSIQQPIIDNFRISIYPDPVRDELQVSYTLGSSSSVKMELMNVTGQIISSAQCGLMDIGNHIININTAGLQEGIYFVQLSIDTQTITQRVIKMK